MREYKEKLKLNLDEKRYNHSIAVADAAKDLAKRFGEDESRAYVAGLLHDCAKYKDIENQLKKCKDYNVEISEFEMSVLPIIHAPLGSVVAQKEYGIEDKEILDAIRYHTVGRAGMTKLDKIIYLADMIEINRNFEGVDILRDAAKTDLDKAMLLAIDKCISFNMKKKTIIHPNTIDAWNDMILIREREKRNGR